MDLTRAVVNHVTCCYQVKHKLVNFFSLRYCVSSVQLIGSLSLGYQLIDSVAVYENELRNMLPNNLRRKRNFEVVQRSEFNEV